MSAKSRSVVSCTLIDCKINQFQGHVIFHSIKWPIHRYDEWAIYVLVALERLELSQTEPESGVLPLHHKAIF